jgi:fructokinase
MLGAVEAGGTKFVCAVGDAEHVHETVSIATRDVATTMADVFAFFDAASVRHGAMRALGIGSFGPLDLDPGSSGFGRITTTPKPGWADADLPAQLRARFGLPVAIDTDVNAAALAEAERSGVSRLAYVTVGTGIGVGIVLDGHCQAGFGHPEGGHIPVRRERGHEYAGACRYHGDCLEGLASGPAMAAAWGMPAAELADDHPSWRIEAGYLGQLCASLILTLAPERIVLGGGVSQRVGLLAMVRAATLRTLGGYVGHWNVAEAERRITAPHCIYPSGLVGAFLLAERATASRESQL